MSQALVSLPPSSLDTVLHSGTTQSSTAASSSGDRTKLGRGSESAPDNSLCVYPMTRFCANACATHHLLMDAVEC